MKSCEQRVEKLNVMRDKIAAKLADPTIYSNAKANDMEAWQRKYAEVMEGLDRAEALWLAALERLDAAEN